MLADELPDRESQQLVVGGIVFVVPDLRESGFRRLHRRAGKPACFVTALKEIHEILHLGYALRRQASEFLDKCLFVLAGNFRILFNWSGIITAGSDSIGPPATPEIRKDKVQSLL